MKLYDSKRNEYNAIACKMPKSSGEISYRSMSWDYVEKNIDGLKIDFHLDKVHGRYMYFNYNNKTYKINLYENIVNSIYDVDELFTKCP